MNLEHCTAQNPGNTVNAGGSYTNILTPDDGWSFTGSMQTPTQRLYCVVTVGGINVTSSVFDSSDGDISIDNVGGNIVITTMTVQPMEEEPKT